MRNWILLAVVAALAVFIFSKPDAGFRLSDADPGGVSQIRIEHMGSPAILLRKAGNDWEITSPIKARAKQEAVEGILSILNAKSDQRIEGRELSHFGLDVPVVSLLLDAEKFDFGMINPLTQQQYVMTGKGIYLVSPKYALIPGVSDLEADHAGTS